MDEETIAATPKETYKKNIKNMINKSAFKYFMQIKETHSKLDQLEYTELKIQPYLKSLAINNKEKELLFNIRSKSHHSKDNFRKLYRNNLNCSLGCLQIEDQIHTFIDCTKLEKINTPVVYDHIFGTLVEQESTIKVFMRKNTLRNHIKKNHILPGGKDCQDPCTFSC